MSNGGPRRATCHISPPPAKAEANTGTIAMAEPLRIRDTARDRYHSLALSSEWEITRLREATALVIGTGALGNEVLKNLAMLGLKTIVMVDRDTVEVANLSRSILFREEDHGRAKVEVVAGRLAEINSDVETFPLNGELVNTVGHGLVRRVDMIFSCLDNRLARRTINRMCQRTEKAWVDGAMENLMGDVTVYLPNAGPCYECNLTVLDRQIIARANSCKGVALGNIARGKVPTTPTMGSIIAAIQVQEAIKLLHGDIKRSLAGRKLVVDCTVNDYYPTHRDRKDDCEGHFRFGKVHKMNAFASGTTTVKEVLEEFQRLTGESGCLRLRHEVLLGLSCSECGDRDVTVSTIRELSPEMMTCPTCGTDSEPLTVNTIAPGDEIAGNVLGSLGVPPLDIVEVFSRNDKMWFELAGDLKEFPRSIQNANTDG